MQIAFDTTLNVHGNRRSLVPEQRPADPISHDHSSPCCWSRNRCTHKGHAADGSAIPVSDDASIQQGSANDGLVLEWLFSWPFWRLSRLVRMKQCEVVMGIWDVVVVVLMAFPKHSFVAYSWTTSFEGSIRLLDCRGERKDERTCQYQPPCAPLWIRTTILLKWSSNVGVSQTSHVRQR